MGGRWNLFELYKVLWVVLMLHLHSDECLSLNLEGLALLEFRSKVEVGPYGALENWDPLDSDPCSWFGVRCIDCKVEILDLKGMSLGGMLATELGKLGHLRSLVLYKNNFSGVIPKEIKRLTMLELLDLRSNNLSGTVPVEIGEMLSFKCLLLSDNKFQDVKLSIQKLNMLSVMECNQSHYGDVAIETGRINRKVGPWIKFKRGSSAQDHKGEHGIDLPSFTEPYLVESAQHIVNTVRRKLLQETHNLPAAPVKGMIPQEVVDVPSIGSGSFQAVSENGSGKDLLAAPSHQRNVLPPEENNTNNSELSGIMGKWPYVLVLPGLVLLLTITGSILMCHCQGGVKKCAWKTGLSDQLQKSLLTGVQELQRSELEAACEDFSNILNSYPDCTMFKGTLSRAVEIAVISTKIASAKDWSRHSEMHFRRREDEPFMRMMVFEYAPNGTLFDHLHVNVFEPLGWSARMRIIMGIAYCLQYMHHQLNPPVAFSDLQSNSIFMTDDYAAKVADLSMWKEFSVAAAKRSKSVDDSDPSESLLSGPGTNVYSFGLLMLEIISGKLPYSEEQGSLLNWAREYLNDEHSIRHLVDPTLENFKDNELDIVCEVIQECVHPDPRHRPNMKEITTKLGEVLAISPDAARPRLSPLWWAELEILSMEAS